MLNKTKEEKWKCIIDLDINLLQNKGQLQFLRQHLSKSFLYFFLSCLIKLKIHQGYREKGASE